MPSCEGTNRSFSLSGVHSSFEGSNLLPSEDLLCWREVTGRRRVDLLPAGRWRTAHDATHHGNEPVAVPVQERMRVPPGPWYVTGAYLILMRCIVIAVPGLLLLSGAARAGGGSISAFVLLPTEGRLAILDVETGHVMRTVAVPLWTGPRRCWHRWPSRADREHAPRCRHRDRRPQRSSPSRVQRLGTSGRSRACAAARVRSDSAALRGCRSARRRTGMPVT